MRLIKMDKTCIKCKIHCCAYLGIVRKNEESLINNRLIELAKECKFYTEGL